MKSQKLHNSRASIVAVLFALLATVSGLPAAACDGPLLTVRTEGVAGPPNSDINHLEPVERAIVSILDGITHLYSLRYLPAFERARTLDAGRCEPGTAAILSVRVLDLNSFTDPTLSETDVRVGIEDCSGVSRYYSARSFVWSSGDYATGLALAASDVLADFQRTIDADPTAARTLGIVRAR